MIMVIDQEAKLKAYSGSWHCESYATVIYRHVLGFNRVFVKHFFAATKISVMTHN